MVYPLHRAADGEQQVPASPDLPAVERDVLAHWASDGTFAASVEARPAGERGANEFVFYDGPPFANGLPHYGHLLTGYVKDVVPRYRTMRGQRVERRFGWDTHGLPAELEAERILGITDKSQIEEMGIEAFNAACRESVLRYTQEWETYVTRQARWVDFENDYKTLDLTFMESVLWAFKQLYDKGLVYEGYRVLPYCWRDETPLSNHELRMDDDVYASRQDPAVTIGVRMETGELLLLWTTTPWTLPSNQAIAVGADLEYVTVLPGPDSPLAGEKVVLARARMDAYARELGSDPQVLATVPGADLVGRRYTPPFGYFAGRNGWHRVLAGDFVTTEDGTGVVHLAPAFGEDDMLACEAAGITPVVPVDGKGRFTAEVHDYAGMQVFEANPQIVADLKAGTGPMEYVAEPQRTRLVRHETYEHAYPHCWRCRNPLIYRAVSSWFVRVTAFRDRMVELNQQITWVPEHVKDGQFGKWLEGARDWSISRNRYWGTPIPVWVSDDPAHPRVDVYGSVADLEQDFGVPVTDLHRPFVDDLTRPNPDDPSGRSTMRRIPDVLDVWFDSGSMPFAQVHYPFEHREWFDGVEGDPERPPHNPADFIVEYIGQTRGWFYTLHVLATALFDRPAFRNVMCHGIVLGDDGRKASKSLRNFPDPMQMWDVYGSDAVRWSLMSSPILRGGNLVVAEDGIRDAVRQVILPLWSTYYFLSLYAGAADGGAGYRAKQVTADRVPGLPPMDRYLLASTGDLVTQVTGQLDEYDVAGACESVRVHLDLLTNWYVRTQRQRFWDEDADAFDTLWTALEVLLRVMAPLAPLITEEIWRGLTGGRSVHLTDWPAPETADSALVAEPELVAAMDRVRDVVSATLGLRKAHGLRVRQPLRELAVAVRAPQALEPYLPLMRSELNIKAITLVDRDEVGPTELGVTTRLSVNARAAGPRLGRAVQAVIRAAKDGRWTMEAEDVVVQTDDGPVALVAGEYELATVVADDAPPGQVAAVIPGDGVVLLDTELDDALRAEGYARDVIRVVQDERKAAGLQVSDRIHLEVTVPAERASDVRDHEAMIARETLAVEVTVTAGGTGDPVATVRRVDG